MYIYIYAKLLQLQIYIANKQIGMHIKTLSALMYCQHDFFYAKLSEINLGWHLEYYILGQK